MRLLIVIFTLLAGPAFPQPTQVKEFDVVSVREVSELLTMEELTRNPRARLPSIGPSQIRMPYESMKSLLLRAFGIPQAQLIAPEWIGSKYYSIEAKMPTGATGHDVPEMLKSMLSARFGLTYHSEMRIVPSAFLTLRKGGLKASLATAESKRAFRPLPTPGASHYELPMTATEFAQSLSQMLNLPVIDNTGLIGRYVFAFDVYSQGRPGEEHPSEADNFTASLVVIHDEALTPLGLHLALKNAPLETVTIDHLAVKPTEN